MNLSLINFSEVKEQEYLSFITEWEKSGEKITPSAIAGNNRSFSEIRAHWEYSETNMVFKQGLVPATLYFLTDSSGQIYGAIHLRHELNERLKLNGGNIGYGIRPSERGKGYGHKMLSLMLDLCRKKGYKKILITCDDDNAGSARIIEKNGGILSDKPLFEGTLTRRYWIDLL